MSKSSKPVPPLHALLGDSQVPVVQAAEGEVQFIKGFRSDLPFAHALTEDGKAIMPVVKVLGAGDGPGPGPGGDSIEQGDGIKIASVGDKKVISTAVPISTSGPTGKHRHWRWDFPATIAEGTFVRVDRIRAIGSDNANIPLNGRTVTSSGSQSAYPASDAFRVDENSGWHWRSSGTAPAWIAIDVGSGNEVQVSSTRLFVATAAAGGRPASVQLSYSDDGVTWTKVGEAALAYEGAWSSSVLAGEGQVPLFIGEAPGDGKAYTRKDGGWTEAVVPDELTVDAGDGIKVDTSVPGKVTVSTLVPISRKGPPGKHRFWRWTFPTNYGDDQLRLQKLRMFDGAGQRLELDATNTTVLASNQSSGAPASNAIYNEATGQWATERFVAFPVWVSVEFTSPLEVASVSMIQSRTLSTARPRTMKVEFSDDGIVWTQALGVTTLTWAGNETTAVPMGDTDIPAFPPYPSKDGKSYVMKDEEWMEYTAPESGTWTPSITTATPSDLMATYTQQAGVYTKVGSLVTVTGRVAFTPEFTGTPGALRIAGLPFTSRPQSGVVSVGNIVGANVDLPEGASIIVGATGSSSNFIGLITSIPGGPYQTLDAETALETGRASELRFSISYEV